MCLFTGVSRSGFVATGDRGSGFASPQRTPKPRVAFAQHPKGSLLSASDMASCLFKWAWSNLLALSLNVNNPLSLMSYPYATSAPHFQIKQIG